MLMSSKRYLVTVSYAVDMKEETTPGINSFLKVCEIKFLRRLLGNSAIY